VPAFLRRLLTWIGAGAVPKTASAPHEPAVDPLADINAANAKLRETAKWIVTSFAAIGALLLAGIQLSSLGKLTAESSGWRIAAVVAGLALAIVAVALTISLTSMVLAPFLNTFGAVDAHLDVADEVLGDRELVGLNYDELKDGIRAADEEVQRAEEAAGNDPDDPAVKDARAAREEWEESKRLALSVIGSRLLWRRYQRARRFLIWGALPLAAVGLAAFAWGANPPDEAAEGSSPPLEGSPTVVAVSLTPAGVNALREARGCSTPTLRALTISGEPGELEVVTIPAGGCDSVRFVLTPNLGTPVAA
jgi:hypothetical protein